MILAQTTAPTAADQGVSGTGTVVQVQPAGTTDTGAAPQLTTAAPGAATQPAPQQTPDFFRSYGLLMVMLVVLWVFLLRSGRGKNKKQDQLLASLKKGDEVQTVGGVLGKVVEVRDDRIQLKVDESANTKIWFSRSAIHRVLGGETAAK
jgi:preprotein translocase subunit YajC